MKKLLLIEDSKLFAKAISRELAVNNYFEVHHAATMAEMIELLEQNQYFVAIADLVLPDASSGEVIYKLIGLDIPVVSLTGSFADSLQASITSLPIVDYVIKESRNDITYAVRLAELMLFTQGMKVLVANGCDKESSIVANHLLPYRFNLIFVSSLEQAKAELEIHKDIALVVCDQQLANDGSGLDLVSAIRNEHDELALPVLFTLVEQGPAFDAKLLKSGVNDFVVKPFSREELASRLVTQVSNRIRYKQIQNYAETVDRYIITSSTDEFGIIRSVSQAFCDISGYSREELIGRNHNIVRHPDMKNAIYKELWQTISAGKSWQGELKNRKKNGTHYWVDVHIDPLFDANGIIVGYTAIRQDITDKKYIEELSVTDPMTGLYNRRHFNEAFAGVSAEVAQSDGYLAFLIFDVDHFKGYNDNYGHQAGDDVLIRIGGCVSAFAKKLSALAYRLGGEEFALLYKAGNQQQAEDVAESLRAAIESLEIEHRYNSASAFVTASFGLYLKQGAAKVSETYKKGDEALYQAKESGRNRVVTQAAIPADVQ
ncbi:diguanylate cyclase domain-containing protein [Oceanospirillum sanctuarii]|uniref:diguanylate cyclase domain-containing protein n=1 Tax=Oceanospirillum sanctuarii TaxID=1434821 RepID=UPI000A363108|nr:diguanylate cyclase [Oceanospirillum sanctuarii]